jgi:hypothetical protein
LKGTRRLPDKYFGEKSDAFRETKSHSARNAAWMMPTFFASLAGQFIEIRQRHCLAFCKLTT